MNFLKKRIDLINMMRAGGIGCEVGVWRGYFSIEILNHSKVGKLYLVDAWQIHGDADPDNATFSDPEGALSETKHHIRGHMAGGRVEIVRGMSVDIANTDRRIPPLDWAFIDGRHTYEATLEDLLAWEKRLKPMDSFLMGHDYITLPPTDGRNYGVIPAVAEFCRLRAWEIAALTEEVCVSYLLQRK